MKLSHIVLLVIMYFLLLTSCSNVRLMQLTDTNTDTLKIEYSDTFLLGKQLFPSKSDSISTSNLDSMDILLFFESGNYYYVFYNTKKLPDFLSYPYWDKLLPKYINFSIGDGPQSYTNYIKVNYYCPYLTGFYNAQDSIIINADWEIKELQNKHQLDVRYFSTTDTVLKLGKNITVGTDVDTILSELKFPINFKPKESFELVLMGATAKITNAWYISCSYCRSNYPTSVVVLLIKNHKLVRIQYADSEYAAYLFKKKNILTKDIHYQ